ncbi:MAG: mechanosensitive ion channel domain-containing protein, partial [Planctomycetota bacterium]
MADLFKSSAWTALEGFLQQLLNWLPFLGVGIFIITVGWFVASLSSRIINRILLKTGLRESLRELVVKLEYVIVLLVGILAGAVVTTGLEVGQVVATLGLGSIALGFAFKDIIENFLAGIIILWKFPYDAGDFIECEGI